MEIFIPVTLELEYVFFDASIPVGDICDYFFIVKRILIYFGVVY